MKRIRSAGLFALFAMLATNAFAQTRPSPSGSPDLNGDGVPDLLWTNAISGESGAWLMNGITQASGAVFLSDVNWQVTATPDLDGDGKSDLI